MDYMHLLQPHDNTGNTQDADLSKLKMMFNDSPTLVNSMTSSIQSFNIPKIKRERRNSIRKNDKRSIVNDLANANKSRQRKNSDVNLMANRLSS